MQQKWYAIFNVETFRVLIQTYKYKSNYFRVKINTDTICNGFIFMDVICIFQAFYICVLTKTSIYFAETALSQDNFSLN